MINYHHISRQFLLFYQHHRIQPLKSEKWALCLLGFQLYAVLSHLYMLRSHGFVFGPWKLSTMKFCRMLFPLRSVVPLRSYDSGCLDLMKLYWVYLQDSKIYTDVLAESALPRKNVYLHRAIFMICYPSPP